MPSVPSVVPPSARRTSESKRQRFSTRLSGMPSGKRRISSCDNSEAWVISFELSKARVNSSLDLLFRCIAYTPALPLKLSRARVSAKPACQRVFCCVVDCLYYTPRINFATLIPNPLDKTSNIGRQTLFLPCSKSEMWPRSMPNRCAISTCDHPRRSRSLRMRSPNLTAMLDTPPLSAVAYIVTYRPQPIGGGISCGP